MMLELGPDESADWHLDMVHVCWSCDYRETQDNWSRRLKTDGQSTLAKIRDRLRGVEIPMRYDREGTL